MRNRKWLGRWCSRHLVSLGASQAAFGSLTRFDDMFVREINKYGTLDEEDDENVVNKQHSIDENAQRAMLVHRERHRRVTSINDPAKVGDIHTRQALKGST